MKGQEREREITGERIGYIYYIFFFFFSLITHGGGPILGFPGGEMEGWISLSKDCMHGSTDFFMTMVFFLSINMSGFFPSLPFLFFELECEM